MKCTRTLFLAAGLAAAWAVAGRATDQFVPEPRAVLEGEAAKPWAAIEHLSDPHPRWPDEPHLPGLHHFFPSTVAGFGTDQPPSRDFLLHEAPGARQAADPVPVLLIPGANDDATRRYAHPLSTKHPDFETTPGLMQYLAARGRSVFAISFSHFHGDNLWQGEQVANAIRRIRRILGRDDDPGFRVDLVTFSKGAMPARCYLGDLRRVGTDGRSFGGYRDDVRRVVFVGGPLAGLDTPFRYYLYNATILSRKIPAPMGASTMLYFGAWKSAGPLDIFSGFWTGQLQMIHDQRLLGVYDGPLSASPDANLSALALRSGGQTLLLGSRGLEAARQAGGELIARLSARGLPPGVAAAALAGTDPIVQDERYPELGIPVGGDPFARGDGLVFVASALYTQGLTARGARILGTDTLPVNHLELSRNPKAYEFVARMLSLP